MPRYSRLLTLLAVGGGVYWTATKFEGPITLNLVVPEGVHVHLNNPYLTSSPSPRAHPPTSPPPPPPPAPPAEKHHHKHVQLPEPDKSIRDAIVSFASYGSSASEIIDRKRARFEQLPSHQRPLADAIGFPAHFEAAERGARSNARFWGEVAQHAVDMYGIESTGGDVYFSMVSEAAGHLVRDWTSEGEHERKSIFPPILNALKNEFLGSSATKRVLVPGFGLGRLAHEIANMKGFDVTACELDYGSILTYRLLVNSTHTPAANVHTLHPFVTKWTHQSNPRSRYSALHFPDMLPTAPVHLVEGNFLTEFTHESAAYDALVSLFFIDVSENIVDFLQTIHRLLKPGGLWVNLGPFKWGTHSQMQLSAEEVIELAGLIGLDVDIGSRKGFEALYAHQPETLLKFTYVTQFWTAKKRV